MPDYLRKIGWLIIATLMVKALFVGQSFLSRADEPALGHSGSHFAGPEIIQLAPKPGANQVMRRLPPISNRVDDQPRAISFDETRSLSGERPEFSHDGRRLFERVSVANWNQDPTNHANPVQLPATQDELGASSAERDFRGDDSASEIHVPAHSDLVTLHLNEVNVRQALEMLSRSHGLSILVAPGVTGQVTANLEGLRVNQALDAIIKLANLVSHREGDLIYVYSAEEFPQANCRVRVFPLDFVSANDVLSVVTSLLTPTGQVTASSVSASDNTKAREAIIVTDRPEVLLRVEEFVRQVDIPPLQVMIEAHVLQIELSDDCKHGINYKQAIALSGANAFELDLTGFANPAASPAVFARIAGPQVDGLLEFLKTTTDAKTLASPRVMVINGQTARIQVGEQIPYKVVTLTETASVETIQFLDVGVVLEVTPRISQDGRVMMRVKPKVSSGTFNPELGLPGEATRELESDVILADGLGMVIGGLIQEKDIETQTKLPYLGDMHWIGRLFQKRQVIKERSEIVITLVPRICYSAETTPERELVDAERSQTPLLMGPLNRYPRPWEPQLPDAICNPQTLRGLRIDVCRDCRQPWCSCADNQPVLGVPLTPSPLAPTPRMPLPEFAPPQQELDGSSQTRSGTGQLGPLPVHIQPVSAAVAPEFEESYRPVPRSLR